MKSPLIASVCFACTSLSLAQAPVPTEFPVEAAPVSAEALRGLLTDKVFSAKMADGSTWRFEYKSNGYFFLNTSRGYADSGKWRTEDGKFCADMNKTGAACSEMRKLGEVLYLKRASNGEVAALITP